MVRDTVFRGCLWSQRVVLRAISYKMLLLFTHLRNSKVSHPEYVF